MSYQDIRKLVLTARSMIDGSMGIVKGCRRVCQLRYGTPDMDDEIFDPFVAVESQTDDYPLEEERARYAADYLKELDQKVSNYVEEVRPRVLEACQHLVERYETKNGSSG